MAKRLQNTESGVIDQAVNALKKGCIVAIPTETVYGLAADATNNDAVAKIYKAKERPAFNPLIAHCGSLDMVLRYVAFSSDAQKLADRFWPGPLTIVLPLKKDAPIAPLVLAGSLARRYPPLHQETSRHRRSEFPRGERRSCFHRP